MGSYEGDTLESLEIPVASFNALSANTSNHRIFPKECMGTTTTGLLEALEPLHAPNNNLRHKVLVLRKLLKT